VTGYLTLSDGRIVELHDGFRIGRGADCELVLHDRKASRHHVRFVVEAGVVEAEDLDSSNGTFLNGKQITRRMLRPGDTLQIGTTTLAYHEGTPAAGAMAGGGAAVPVTAVFAEEDELSGGPVAAPAAAPAPAPVAPPPAPPRPALVEFADEVVEVRQTAPRPPGATAGLPAAPVGAVVEVGRVLHYSKNAQSRSVLGDDVGQLSSGARALVFVLVLAGMALLAWAVTVLVR
jgi:predicted component of type VI protein secretion system